MCSNPCESEVTCFLPISNRGPYGLLISWVPRSPPLSYGDGWITENPFGQQWWRFSWTKIGFFLFSPVLWQKFWRWFQQKKERKKDGSRTTYICQPGKKVRKERKIFLILARRYLAMPATSTPIGCLFSVAVKFATAKRACLDLHTVTLLVFLHKILPVVREMTVRQIVKDTIIV